MSWPSSLALLVLITTLAVAPAGAQADADKASKPSATAARAPAGTVKWRRALGGTPMRSCTTTSGLVLQAVIRPRAKKKAQLVALDASSGAVRWRAPLEGRSVQGVPVVAGDMVIHGTFEGPVIAFDVATGARRWVFRDKAFSGVHGAPQPVGDRVWVGGLGGVVALNLATGELSRRLTGRGGHNVLYADGSQVVVQEASSSIVAYGADDGVERWRLAGPVIDRQRNIAAGFQAEQAGAFDGALFVPTNDAELWAVDLGTGKKRWGHEPGGGTFGTVVDDGQLFLITAGEGVEGTVKESWAARLDPRTGARLWRRAFKGLSMATPAVVGGVVVVPTARAGVLLLERSTGQVRATVKTRSPVWWGGCVTADLAFVGVDSGHMLAVSAR